MDQRLLDREVGPVDRQQRPKASCLAHGFRGRCEPELALAERRDAQDELHSAAQAGLWAGGGFDADHGFVFDGVGRPAN
jgi:hypothetical protein